MLNSPDSGCSFSARCFFRLGVLLMALLLSTSVLAGSEKFRSGILASLSLITRHHMTIIWAIEELERKQKPKESKSFYSEGYYYQMLVRKPAQKIKPPPNRPFTLAPVFAVPFPQQPSSQPGASAQTPEEMLVDDMARLQMVTPGDTVPFPHGPTPGMRYIFPREAEEEGEAKLKRMRADLLACQSKEDIEKRQKEQQRRESLHSRQAKAGRVDPGLSFFIGIKSDAMSNPNAEQCSASSDVSSDHSTSPYYSPSSGSPHQPHYLTSGRKRSGKTKYDGYFVGDSCRAIEQKALPQKAYFGGEYQEQEYFNHRQLAMAREDREWDFLEIKFRVYERRPDYQFGLKKEMLCNVYFVRGRYYELCAPYAMPLDASLSELSKSRYVEIDQDISAKFACRQLDEDENVINLLKGFEKTIHGQLQNRFVSKGQEFIVDDGYVTKKRVACIGRGQCAVVWKPGSYNLAFRRYAGHTEQSALQQAWVQQASYAIYEQLSMAHDPEKGVLKKEEDIGLAPPMSLGSTRVYSRFIPLQSPDSSWSLYEVQPLIPRDELVEYYLDLLIYFGTGYQVSVPLYYAVLNGNTRAGANAVASLEDIMTLIIEEILAQLETMTENLSRYLESREPGSINIGIDPKVANYQVRFCDIARYQGQQKLRVFLANYDGYPPNLLLFSSKEDPQKSVLFKGGELYRLLNEYFDMYGFTEAFVGRTMKLNTLDRQVVKMLASIAGEIDSRFAPAEQMNVKERVLPFFLNVVNRWMKDRAQRNNLSPPMSVGIAKIFEYQRDSALYHRAFRLHLLAAEVGAKVNPEKYSLPRAEFPVSDEQSEWLEQQRQEYLLHMVAFFAVDDIEGLQLFLEVLLGGKKTLPDHTSRFLEAIDRIVRDYDAIFQRLIRTGNFETLTEIIRDAFDAQSLPDEEGGAQLLGGSAHPTDTIEECRFSGSCAYSRREHSLHHMLLRRLFLIRSSMPFSETQVDVRAPEGPALDSFQWIEQLTYRNIQLSPRSEFSTRLGLFSGLLQVPRDRLTAVFRNTHNRLKRRQRFRIQEQEELLNQLQSILRQSSVEPGERASSEDMTGHRNTLLLASLLLDHPFIWIEPSSGYRDGFRIFRYQLAFDAGSPEGAEQLKLGVEQKPLTPGELEQLVLQEQAEGVHHYYVLANPRKNEWSVLVPTGTGGPVPIEVNPEDNPDPLLEEVSKPEEKQKKNEGRFTDEEHKRRRRYSSELRLFLRNINFQSANTPQDHFCLFHALTVILNAKGKNVTIEDLKRHLRIFLAKLLVKISLYPQDIVLGEFQLIQQLGLTYLLDLLDELFMAQGAGPHQGPDVWGDYNLILLTAVVFDVGIPFVNLNIEHINDDSEPLVQFNMAQPDGVLTPFNAQQLPGMFIFFDEHPREHWNLAFNPVYAEQITPLFHWIHDLPPSQPVTGDEEMFTMESIDISDLSAFDFTGDDFSNPALFDFPGIFPSTADIPTTPKPLLQHPLQQASQSLPPQPLADMETDQLASVEQRAPQTPLLTKMDTDQQPHSQEQQPPGAVNNQGNNLMNMATIFVLGNAINARSK